MACNIEELLQDACLNGFNCLPSQRSYDIVLAQLLCEILEASGGGGGGGGGSSEGEVFTGFYGGGTPTQTPTQNAAIAYDRDPPQNMWVWDGSTWI